MNYDSLQFYQRGVYNRNTFDKFLGFDQDGYGLDMDSGEGDQSGAPLATFFCKPFENANLIRENGMGLNSPFKFREMSGTVLFSMRIWMNQTENNEQTFDFDLRFSDDTDTWLSLDTNQWNKLFILRIICRVIMDLGNLKTKCKIKIRYRKNESSSISSFEDYMDWIIAEKNGFYVIVRASLAPIDITDNPVNSLTGRSPAMSVWLITKLAYYDASNAPVFSQFQKGSFVMYGKAGTVFFTN